MKIGNVFTLNSVVCCVVEFSILTVTFESVVSKGVA